MIVNSVGFDGGRRVAVAFLVTAIATAIAMPHASATTINIVALGASNTAGKGVGASAAWPARLEAMLRAKGYDVSVTNSGIRGDDTSGMLARVGAVPNGTQIVILDKAASSDRRRDINTNANIAAIVARLRARGIRSIVIEGMHGWANNQLQADGIHITEAGHAAVAARLQPMVIAAIGGRWRR
jgi:acyl-CoA thioesterase-1